MRFIIIIIFLLISYGNADILSAANIPWTNLRLELSLTGSTRDSSSNLRPVSLTGSSPLFTRDPVYNLPYAQFNGSGAMMVNTAWTPTDSASVSFWTRIDNTSFGPNQQTEYTQERDSKLVSNLGALDGMRYMYPMVLFSLKNNALDSRGWRVAMNNEFLCSMGAGNIDSVYRLNWYRYGVQESVFSSFNDTFDCSAFKDSKWHHMVFRVNPNTIEVIIDGKTITKNTYPSNYPYNYTLSRNLSIGGYSFPLDNTLNSVATGSTRDKIYWNHFFRGGMMGFRLYSSSLTDIEVNNLFAEYSHTQSSFTGTGNIKIAMEQYTKPNLSITLRGLPLTYNKKNTVYEYSYTGTNFISLSGSLTDISTNTGVLDYRAILNLSSIPDGKLNITLRARTATETQILGSFTYLKDDGGNYSITINQPNTTSSESKTITASFTGNNGVLSMATTNGTLCDASLTFSEYSDITFTLKTDNGIRLCYRAYYPDINKTIYKISLPIMGIVPTTVVAKDSTLFDNYALWPKSNIPKLGDTRELVLDLLGLPSTLGNGVTITDINGDGLVDFIYSKNDTNSIRRAIVVNNGNYTFKLIYKCAIDPEILWTARSGNFTYYGDCADITK